MSCKSSSLPHQTTLSRQQRGYFSTYQLIADGLVAVRIDLVCIRHFPCPTRAPIIIRHRFCWSCEFGLVRVERIAVFILRAADLTGACFGVDLENCILWTVNVGIYPHAEEMLVIVSIDAWIDLRAPAVSIFSWVHGVGVQDARELDLELHGSVLVENPVNAVFVVCCSEYVRNQQLPSSSHNNGVVSEVSVLEEYAGVFFVDADGVLDRLACTGTVDEVRIHVVDGPFTIAAESEAVGHVATSVFTQIKGMFPLMRVLRVPIWYYHLCE